MRIQRDDQVGPRRAGLSGDLELFGMDFDFLHEFEIDDKGVGCDVVPAHAVHCTTHANFSAEATSAVDDFAHIIDSLREEEATDAGLVKPADVIGEKLRRFWLIDGCRGERSTTTANVIIVSVLRGSCGGASGGGSEVEVGIRRGGLNVRIGPEKISWAEGAACCVDCRCSSTTIGSMTKHD